MYLAIPARITELIVKPASKDIIYAIVEFMGNHIQVNIQQLEQPEIGDYILLHDGRAVKKIDLAYFNFLNNIYYSWLEEC
jgi:hydrogenase expression/formation protein HypC